ASRLLDGVEEALVMRGDLQTAVVLPLDDCRRDRQRREQAGVVRGHQVRFGTQIVRPPLPRGSLRPGRCSLHRLVYAAEGLIQGIFFPLQTVVNRSWLMA